MWKQLETYIYWTKFHRIIGRELTPLDVGNMKISMWDVRWGQKHFDTKSSTNFVTYLKFFFTYFGFLFTIK